MNQLFSSRFTVNNKKDALIYENGRICCYGMKIFSKKINVQNFHKKTENSKLSVWICRFKRCGHGKASN